MANSRRVPSFTSPRTTMYRTTRSQRFFLKAQSIIPGGVNSPAQVFTSAKRPPLFIKKASAAYLWDEDGNKFIDYAGSWGAMILGHANPGILKAVRTAVRSGTSLGAPTLMEVRLAELVAKLIPSIEMLRIVNSGGGALVSAIRLARVFTKREMILTFEGCHHGHGGPFLFQAGGADRDHPSSVAASTLTARFNDLASVQEVFRRHEGQIAAVVVEPVVGSMGCVPPLPGFLEGLRTACDQNGSLLIFDEVVTGFRIALGGAQELYNVRPDLTTLGKILGGGLPVGAYGGRREIMMRDATQQTTTLPGDPLTMAAGYQMLRILSSNRLIYRRLEEHGAWLEEGMRDILKRAGRECAFNRVGSMFTLYFTGSKVIDRASAATADTEAFSRFFSSMLDSGVHFPPSPFEPAFLSTAHTERIIAKTLRAAARALKRL